MEYIPLQEHILQYCLCHPRQHTIIVAMRDRDRNSISSDSSQANTTDYNVVYSSDLQAVRHEYSLCLDSRSGNMSLIISLC